MRREVIAGIPIIPSLFSTASTQLWKFTPFTAWKLKNYITPLTLLQTCSKHVLPGKFFFFLGGGGGDIEKTLKIK